MKILEKSTESFILSLILRVSTEVQLFQETRWDLGLKGQTWGGLSQKLSLRHSQVSHRGHPRGECHDTNLPWSFISTEEHPAPTQRVGETQGRRATDVPSGSGRFDTAGLFLARACLWVRCVCWGISHLVIQRPQHLLGPQRPLLDPMHEVGSWGQGGPRVVFMGEGVGQHLLAAFHFRGSCKLRGGRIGLSPTRLAGEFISALPHGVNVASRWRSGRGPPERRKYHDKKHGRETPARGEVPGARCRSVRSVPRGEGWSAPGVPGRVPGVSTCLLGVDPLMSRSHVRFSLSGADPGSSPPLPGPVLVPLGRVPSIRADEENGSEPRTAPLPHSARRADHPVSCTLSSGLFSNPFLFLHFRSTTRLQTNIIFLQIYDSEHLTTLSPPISASLLPVTHSSITSVISP